MRSNTGLLLSASMIPPAHEEAVNAGTVNRRAASHHVHSAFPWAWLAEVLAEPKHRDREHHQPEQDESHDLRPEIVKADAFDDDASYDDQEIGQGQEITGPLEHARQRLTRED